VRESRIVRRSETKLSEWVTLVSKDVEHQGETGWHTYHSVLQADYVSVLALTPNGLTPVVRQFRPAVEEYTLELPGGLLESGEDPNECCRRELFEETGLQAREIISMGSYFPDPGRLGNRLHAFFVRASDEDPEFRPEPGISIDYFSPRNLRAEVIAGRFIHQLHIAMLGVAEWKGLYPR
jgi:ADP-ribose pyrophosphatase